MAQLQVLMSYEGAMLLACGLYTAMEWRRGHPCLYEGAFLAVPV